MTRLHPAVAEIHGFLIEGADARAFAQAQFSGDVDSLAPASWQWNAWLTPQGRVRALMHLLDPGDGTLLALLRGGEPDAIRDALAPYLLRRQAKLGLRTFTGRAGAPLPPGTVKIEGDAIAVGYGSRSLVLDAAGEAPRPAAQNAWRLEDIRQGWPTLPAGDPELLPQALGLEHLAAVSFHKGCYPGQEIAARLHYRGGHKYRLYHVRGTPPLPEGSLELGNRRKARVLDAAFDDEAVEALVTAPLDLATEPGLPDDRWRIVTGFEA